MLRLSNLINHASKVILKIIQKRITPRIKESVARESGGLQRGQSKIEQITTLRIMNKKARGTGNMIIHNFIDFRNAFGTMGKYNIGERKITLIQNLHEKARSKCWLMTITATGSEPLLV